MGFAPCDPFHEGEGAGAVLAVRSQTEAMPLMGCRARMADGTAIPPYPSQSCVFCNSPLYIHSGAIVEGECDRRIRADASMQKTLPWSGVCCCCIVELLCCCVDIVIVDPIRSYERSQMKMASAIATKSVVTLPAMLRSLAPEDELPPQRTMDSQEQCANALWRGQIDPPKESVGVN